MALTSAPDWRAVLKRRVTVVGVGVFLWVGAIESRLVYLQVLRHDEFMARAERQQSRTVTTYAKRGEIIDRHGNLLAYSVDADTIYAVPAETQAPTKTAAALCDALGDCSRAERRTLVERLSSKRSFVYVRRQVSSEQFRRVSALQLEGIGFMKESRRYYPKRELASHVVGYVGVDNGGLAGIESTYDKIIRGEAGKAFINVDAKRRPFSKIDKPPAPGATLELTIDQQYQYIAERELRAGVEENGARGGSVVMMDPRTGEILAMANWPTFNPNDYRSSSSEAQRNRAIQDIYEPGSTFKVVTAGAAIELKVVTPEQLIDASGGRIAIGKRVVRDTHDYGVLSFTDAIVKSSNVGAIRVGLKLGPERLSEYIARFGFGRRSSPDFPGENPGIVWSPSKLNDSALASVSMGYQVSVTPLQMVAAVSSVANGGELVQPRVVRAVIRDGVRTVVPRKVVTRTLEKQTVDALTAIMEQVVERGTAKGAQFEGFTIAGKTGTAAQLVDGRYSANLWNASFVGFAPSRNPEFALIVVIDAPRKKGHTGGVAAAPVFKRIAEAVLRLRAVPRSIDPEPPVLVDRGPTTPTIVPVAPVESNVANSSAVTLPDLRGMGAREAMQALSSLGIEPRIKGTGIVVDQWPAPNSVVEPGSVSTVRLERRYASMVP